MGRKSKAMLAQEAAEERERLDDLDPSLPDGRRLSELDPETIKALHIASIDMALRDEIPTLRADNIPEYIAAINHALLHSIISPGIGKCMLYGAQLYLAAANQMRAPQLQLPTGPPTIEGKRK